MRKETHCAICKEYPGRHYGKKHAWYELFQFRPNRRGAKQTWLCQFCIAKLSKMERNAMLDTIRKTES